MSLFPVQTVKTYRSELEARAVSIAMPVGIHGSASSGGGRG